MDHPEELTVLSLCTGIRGLDRGIERVIGPGRTVAFVEIEAFAVENLLAGMEAGVLAPAPIWTNLKTFPWGKFRHKIFFFVGGYPCQPFSNAGLRKGAEDTRHLWPYIEFGIRTIRPVCVFFENVRGHVDLGGQQVIESLRALGYAVECGIYSAEEVGAPHQRTRLFILGILADAKYSQRRTFHRWLNRIETRESPLYENRTEDPSGFKQRGKAVAYSDSGSGSGARGFHKQAGRTESSNCCEELADPDGVRSGTDPGDIIQAGCYAESKEQREERDKIQRKRNGPDPGDSGTVMADSNSQGLEEWGEQSEWQERQAIERGRNVMAHPNVCRQQQWFDSGMGGIAQSDAWPAGPGQQQYAWEAKRTIESGMGCAINGYNFREDLLRALGNGVVEQQAELALRNLLRKHFG